MRKIKKLLALTMCVTMMMTNSVYAKTVFEDDRFYPGDSWETEDGEEYEIPNSFFWPWSRKVQWEFKEEGEKVAYEACWATVGYDTWWTNEDYIKSVGGAWTYSVRGAVKNSDGTWSADTEWKTDNLSGKVDVKHTGKTVTYCLELGY